MEDAGRRGRRPLHRESGKRAAPQDRPYGGTAKRLPPPPSPIGADARPHPQGRMPAPTRRGGFHIRPSNRPRQPPRQRQRGQQDRPFFNHPEVCARPANAAQDRCNCQSPARVGRRVSYYSRKRFRRPPSLSVGAHGAPATRPSVLFFWTGRGPFSFRQDRKENGGRIAAAIAALPRAAKRRIPPPPFGAEQR